MIERQEQWTAQCDSCKKIYLNYIGKRYDAICKSVIIADLKTNSWKVKNNKCYCPDCKDKGRN